MGSACGIKCKLPSQPTKIQRRQSKSLNNINGSETEIEGIPMRTACIGHYFSESSYTNNDETAIREVWRKICSPKLPPSKNTVPLFVRRKRLLIDVGLNEADAEVRLLEFAEANPEAFNKLLIEGPPARYRWVAWKVALRVKNVLIPGLYEELTKKRTPWADEIEKDIDRTFPTHPLFSEVEFCEKGKGALRNVLSAYANYNKYVGYCQGVNFISAFLLILSGFQEEETFWAIVSLTRYKFACDPLGIGGIEGLYSDQFPLLRSLEWLFSKIAEEYLPTITKHLFAIEFSNGFWLQKWISTIFLYSFPQGYCIRFWDFILTRGISQIFPLIIAVIEYLSGRLLISDFAGCYELLSTLKDNEENLPPIDTLIKTANKIKLDWESLSKLYKKYQEETEKEDFEERKKHAKEKGRMDVNPQDTDRELIEEIVEENKTSFPEIKRLNKRHKDLDGISESKEIITLPPINQKKKTKFVFESDNLLIFQSEFTKRERGNNLNNSVELPSSKKEFSIRHPVKALPNIFEDDKGFKKKKHSNKKLNNSHHWSDEKSSLLFEPVDNYTERPKIRQEAINRSVRELRSRVITKKFFY